MFHAKTPEGGGCIGSADLLFLKSSNDEVVEAACYGQCLHEHRPHGGLHIRDVDGRGEQRHKEYDDVWCRGLLVPAYFFVT